MKKISLKKVKKFYKWISLRIFTVSILGCGSPRQASYGTNFAMLVRDFYNAILGTGELVTTLLRSVESLLTLLAIKKLRITGKVSKVH